MIDNASESNQPRSISELLQQRAAERPNNPFLLSEANSCQFTYAQFEAAVDRAASMLAAHGIGKSDAVSLLMPNSAGYIIAYFACWKLGARAGPVNSPVHEHEIECVMNKSE